MYIPGPYGRSSGVLAKTTRGSPAIYMFMCVCVCLCVCVIYMNVYLVCECVFVLVRVHVYIAMLANTTRTNPAIKV